MTPSFHGYVDVGALELYCERHGNGHPLVLLHGAFGTIESCFADLLPGTSHEGHAQPGRVALLHDHPIPDIS